MSTTEGTTMTTKFESGDLVTGGEIGCDDFDIGEAYYDEAGQLWVAWEGGAEREKASARGLRVVSRVEADGLWERHAALQAEREA